MSLYKSTVSLQCVFNPHCFYLLTMFVIITNSNAVVRQQNPSGSFVPCVKVSGGKQGRVRLSLTD